MRFTVLSVGKPRNSALADLVGDYETRAARYWPLLFVEVKEESGRSLSATQVCDKEGERILAKVSGDTRLVVCDALGESLSSEQFAAFMQKSREEGSDVAFAIGGANGLGRDVKERAFRTLSLSSLTLPHEIARLVLAEQLYRAGTIQRGEPYHK